MSGIISVVKEDIILIVERPCSWKEESIQSPRIVHNRRLFSVDIPNKAGSTTFEDEISQKNHNDCMKVRRQSQGRTLVKAGDN